MSLKQYLDNGWIASKEPEEHDQQKSVDKWILLQGKHANSSQTSYVRFCIMSTMLNTQCNFSSNRIDAIRYHCLQSEKHSQKISTKKPVPIKKSKFYNSFKHIN